MFTTHTGRRYRLPTRHQLRMQSLRKHGLHALQCLCIAALLVSPLFAHLLD